MRLGEQMNSLGNKGITLIEIILTTAVSMTVILAITIFMTTGNKSYNEAKKSLNLQAEAQILMNQICDKILEANCIDDYNFEKRECAFYQVNENTKQIEDMVVLWYDGESNLYSFKEKPKTGEFKPDEKNLLARHVKTIDIKRDGSLVTVFFVLNQGKKEYQLKNQIRLRNEPIETGN